MTLALDYAIETSAGVKTHASETFGNAQRMIKRLAEGAGSEGVTDGIGGKRIN